MIVERMIVIIKGNLFKLIITQSVLFIGFLCLSIQTHASETWYIDTPSGFQRMGGASRMGPYSSKEQCESVNRQHFENTGTCIRTSTSTTPSAQQQSDDNYREILRRQKQEEEHKRKLLEAEEEARRLEEARRKEFEQDKQNALKLLKSTTDQLGLKSVTDNGMKLKGFEEESTGLKLKGIEEPLFSKGTKYSAPVNLKSIPSDKSPVISPDVMKMKSGTSEKGLKTSYVPKPSFPLADCHYENKTRNDIILDALEVGRGDFLSSVKHLESYLKEINPDIVKVQEALSYIQGMAEGDYIVNKKEESRDPFAPAPEDSSALLEAISSKSQWPGPTVNPDQPVSFANPLDWKSVRDRAIYEAFESLLVDTEELTRDDLQKCLQLIEKQVQKNPEVNGYSQALQFFKGVITYY
jgi:hypothetical protein